MAIRDALVFLPLEKLNYFNEIKNNIKNLCIPSSKQHQHPINLLHFMKKSGNPKKCNFFIILYQEIYLCQFLVSVE